jgi:hypothetical protein
MLFCGEMRRSSIWFLIAGLWLIDVVLNVVQGHGSQVWLTAVIAVAFVVVGLVHRSRESRSMPRRPLR